MKPFARSVDASVIAALDAAPGPWDVIPGGSWLDGLSPVAGRYGSLSEARDALWGAGYRPAPTISMTPAFAEAHDRRSALRYAGPKNDRVVVVRVAES